MNWSTPVVTWTTTASIDATTVATVENRGGIHHSPACCFDLAVEKGARMRLDSQYLQPQGGLFPAREAP